MTYIYLKNKFLLKKKAYIKPFNASTMYGINVFEVFRVTYSIKENLYYVFRLSSHLKRLRSSANKLNIKINYSNRKITHIIKQLIKKNSFKFDHTYRITLLLDGDGSWNIKNKNSFLIISPSKKIKNNIKSAKLIISSIPKNFYFDQSIKTGANYLNARYAQIKNKSQSNIIFFNNRGFLAEALNANIFIFKDNVYYTPSSKNSILSGVTRDTIIKYLKYSKKKLIIKYLSKKDLLNAEEIFLTSTTNKITKVLSLDGKALKTVNTIQIAKDFYEINLNKLKIHNNWILKING